MPTKPKKKGRYPKYPNGQPLLVRLMEGLWPTRLPRRKKRCRVTFTPEPEKKEGK
jgi:hypothetical protein